MPGMDGYMLMRQVRAIPSEEGGQVKAIAAGFQMHLSKPILPEQLIEAVIAVTGNECNA
jgi:CheY-like chemotaxis protein